MKEREPHDMTLFAAALRELSEDLLNAASEDVLDRLQPEVSIVGWRPRLETHLTFMGHAIGHPVLGTKSIATSQVFFWDQPRGLVRTLSRWYRLEQPEPLVRQ